MRDLACLLVPVLCLAASPQVGHAQNVLDSYLSPGLTTFSGEQRVTTIDDMDGDGLRDLVVGNRGGVLFPNSWCEVHIIGSLTRTVVQAYAGTPQSGVIGSIVHGLPDLDGDGRDEVAFSAPEALIPGLLGPGYLLHFSLDAPQPIRMLTGESTGDSYRGGLSLTGGLDWDGDGLSDVAVTSFDTAAGAHVVKIVSQCFGHTKPVCDGMANSTGQIAELTTCAVIDYDRGLHFGLSGLPSQAFTVLYMAPGELAGPVQPIGTCLGTQAFAVLLDSTGPVFNAHADGTAHVRMSLSKHARFPSSSWLAGTTWAFQANYGDIGLDGVPVLAWSDAIELTLP